MEGKKVADCKWCSGQVSKTGGLRRLVCEKNVSNPCPRCYTIFISWLTTIFSHSFQCMFQFGFEQRGSSSAGLLALEGLANVFHASMLAEDGNKFAAHVTIYTNNNPTLATELETSLQASSITVDDRKLRRLIPGDGSPSEVTIDFEDGTSKTEAFIIHRPNTELDPRFVRQLGLKVSDRGDIEVMPPFCQTNVSRVYAACDCASPMKIIPNAISMGAYAACGLSRELQRRITGNDIVYRGEAIKVG